MHAILRGCSKPTKLTVNIAGKEEDFHYEFEQPREGDKFLFRNGIGFTHEIEHVHQCWRSGKKESDIQPLATSVQVLRVLDEVRRQVGVVYPCEEEQ
jgi:hypothetical protein